MSIKEMLLQNKDEIIRRYLKGESTCALGRAYGCANSYIWILLKELGVPIRVTARAKEKHSEIVRLHKEEKLSAYRIAKTLGVSGAAVSYQLRLAGFDISGAQKKREIPLMHYKDEIISQYKAWIGGETIAKRYNTTGTNILKLLRKCGVQTRSVRDYAYPVDESYFDIIDTPNKAWVCGWWFADGCNSPHIPVLRLAITDEEIIQMAAKEMRWEGPIYPIDRNGHKRQFSLTIGSRRLSNALLELGCLRRKTYHGIFPPEECIPPELHSHLIRGWFEGNGCLCKNKDSSTWHYSISGTHRVCHSITSVIFEHTGVQGAVYAAHKGENHTTYTYSLGEREKVRTVLNWMYNDAELFLERKHQRYKKFLRLNP